MGVTMERDLLRPSQVLKLLPVLKPRPTPGMATMDMVTDHTDTATMATDLMAMATTERDLPMPSPLPMLLPAPKPRPILGMATMVMLTGDKSESQEQHPLFPADSSVKHQFLQNNF